MMRPMGKFDSRRLTSLILCRSYCAAVSKARSSAKYSKTLLFPTSSFENVYGKQRVDRERHVAKICEFDELYEWQRQSAVADTRSELSFVVHDGPPYANGPLHFGHAINKILKDITVRYKMMRGYKIHFVPGWDCHGLPIELKALLQLNLQNGAIVDKLTVRKEAREFASKWIDVQMKSFQSWAVLGDWEEAYRSYSTEFIASELELFFKLYQKGYIHQEYKPVHWSYASRSALADAELIYNDNHQSLSAFVKFHLRRVPFACNVLPDASVAALVWTTNPWTIPANRAICFSPGETYCVVRSPGKDLLLVATKAKSELEQTLSTHFDIVSEFEGSALVTATYVHPLTQAEHPLLPSDHVTVAKGTGLVHIAPAHGQDDYLVALKNSISVDCLVDDSVRFNDFAGVQLRGKFVLDEGNAEVIKMLADRVVHCHTVTHSYPYDWRTNTPVILRASLQWFLNTERIKDKAVKCLEDDVCVHPSFMKASMISSLKKRPYWCISRQRAWGVPIPVFYASGKPLISRAIVDHLISLLRNHGPDFWWTLKLDELLPDSVLLESGLSTDVAYRRGEDILDIWFDSGSTWFHVLRNIDGGGRVADLCLEGVDQVGGWFQTSLLTSCALTGKAPFSSLYFHGFALDDKGCKMSKSLGNVIDPDTVINGDSEKAPALGVDVLRWWIALHSSGANDTPVSVRTLRESSQHYDKIRLTFKYLLGLLNDFDRTHLLEFSDDLQPVDRYMLHQLYHFKKEVTDSYEKYSYNAAVKSTLNFIVNDVSKFYIRRIKDRMYCDDRLSLRRRSCATVVQLLVTVLSQLLAPVMPHLAEDVLLNFPSDLKSDRPGRSVFHSVWSALDDTWLDSDLARIVDRIIVLSDAVNKFATDNRLKHEDLEVVVRAAEGSTLLRELMSLQVPKESCDSPLCEIFDVACTVLDRLHRSDETSNRADIIRGVVPFADTEANGGLSDKYEISVRLSEKPLCLRCRRRRVRSPAETNLTPADLCPRCANVLIGCHL